MEADRTSLYPQLKLKIIGIKLKNHNLFSSGLTQVHILTLFFKLFLYLYKAPGCSLIYNSLALSIFRNKGKLSIK